jgi:hypothetical protein
MLASNVRERPPPCAFASYIAMSALRISSWLSALAPNV